jgi:hypothetical protein
MSTLFVTVLAAAALVWSACAQAHSNEELAHRRGPHGGQLQMTGNYHVELLVADGKVQVWVTDHAAQAQPTAGASGAVMMVYPNGTITTLLAPTGGNELAGKNAQIKLADGVRVSVVVTMKGQAPGQTRFVLGSAATAPAGQVAAHPH